MDRKKVALSLSSGKNGHGRLKRNVFARRSFFRRSVSLSRFSVSKWPRRLFVLARFGPLALFLRVTIILY